MEHEKNTDGSGELFLRLRSAEATDMLERPPSWLMRWGVLSLVLVFALLGAISIMIKYPDTLEGKAIVTTDPLPIRLKPRAGGRIVRLFVADGAAVTQGMPVAETENTAGYDNILKLGVCIDSVSVALHRKDSAALLAVLNTPLRSLGEAQNFYNQLIQQLSALLLLQKEQIYKKRTDNLNARISDYRAMARINAEEMTLISEELKQADERFRANEKLFKDHVISLQEYYDEAAKLRQKKLSLEQQKTGKVQHSIAIGENDKQILELRYDKEEKERQMISGIEESLRNLDNYIRTWKQQYLLQAPYNGRVQYLRPLQENEIMAAGEELFAILPQKCHYAAQLLLPAAGMGKIKQEQQVHLMLDNYPYNEYGYLEGRVVKWGILPEPQQNNANGQAQQALYRVYIALPDTLQTSYRRYVPFSPEMGAVARVITKDRNLLQRLLGNIGKINN